MEIKGDNYMRTFEKELMVAECVNLSAWYKAIRDDKTKLNGLSVQFLWALKKNMKKVDEVTISFEEFRNGLEEQLKKDYFNEEKSEPTKFTDENGKEVEGRKIKQKYFDDYQNELNSLNTQISDLLATKEKLTFTDMNIEDEIEQIDSRNITIDDLDMFSAFEEDA